MADQDTLGGRLRVLRAMARTNQKELAKVIGKTSSTMSLLETNQQDPTAPQLEALAMFLGERLGWSKGRVLLYLFGIADIQIQSEVENFKKAPSKVEPIEESWMPCDVSLVAA